MVQIKTYIVTLVIVLAIDLVWLLLIMPGFYEKQLSGFNRPEKIPFWSALIAWLLIPLGIAFFVLPLSKSTGAAALNGAVYGLILYGMYGFTNYAILADWTKLMLAVDVIWGTVLCSVSSVLSRVVLAWIR